MNNKPIVIVSGFRPFGHRKKLIWWGVNASWTVAKHIYNRRQSQVAGAFQFPVPAPNGNWSRIVSLVEKQVSAYQPDVWIAFGEDENSTQFQIELMADSNSFPSKYYPKPQPAPTWNNIELCATLARRMNNKKYPTLIDHNAGGYICEQMLHTLLSNPNHKSSWPSLAIFIHVPIETDILVDKNGNKYPNSEQKLKEFGVEIFDQVLILYNK